MPLVSVTRLRLRSARFLPGFAWQTWLSAPQVRRSPGFLEGYLAGSQGLAFWTITVWTDEAAMRAFRSADPHLTAMGKLIDWCDEAAVVHWDQAGSEAPSPEAVSLALQRSGRLSKVRNPSPAHAAGQTWPDAKTPRRARALARLQVTGAPRA